MTYYKTEQDGYILSVSTNSGGTEISKEEYENLVLAISNRPNKSGKGYKLRSDMTWEEYNLPPVTPAPPTEAERLAALENQLAGIVSAYREGVNEV